MSFHVSLVGRKNLSREIYRQISRAILEGRLRPGDRQRGRAQRESLRGGEQLCEWRLRGGQFRLLDTRRLVERGEPRFGLCLAEWRVGEEEREDHQPSR